MCTLYERLQSLCKNKGVSPSRMCLDLGLSKSTMSDLKNGRKKGLSAVTANKIANYLGVSVDYLLTGESEQKNIPATQMGSGNINDEPKGYSGLTPENQEFIDQMIAKLLASQSQQ